MSDSPELFAPFEPELLVATCSAEGSLLVTNEAWESVFGSVEASWNHLSPDDQALIGQYLKEATGGMLVTNQIFPVQVPGRDEPLPVLLNFLPVKVANAQNMLTIQAITITGEVLAEPTSWTVSQTQRHRLETLGRMTMGIAHDFNNLLSGILGYTELLKSFTPTHDESTYDEHLSTVEKAALDGAALVRKIQQFIRQEKERRFEPLDMPSLLQDCLLFTRPYWYNEPRRQGIEISMDADYQEVPPIMGTASELREVFVNMILNAVQAMPNGGHISVRVETDQADRVRVRIGDTGTGMTETVRQRIFEPLFTTKGERGTGMGLAVSYGIIQEHDGAISVASQLGKGTEFVMTFPVAVDEAIVEAEAPEEIPREAARVLIVDDEEMVRNVLAKLLSLRGHDVQTAPSGSVALDITQTHSFDVIIVDQAMPEMNGRVLADHLRTRFPDLPIVLLTGDTDVGEVGPAINIILSKPFQIEEVDDTIQKLIGSGAVDNV